MKPIAHSISVNSFEQGSVLLEALIAIVIFSVGLVGLIGIQAKAIGMSMDAKDRADAAYLSNQIVSQMWLDRANIAQYAHHPDGVHACGAASAGAASTNTKVHNGTTSGSWTYQVARSLPGATEDQQQIKVTVPVGASYSQVEIAICWKRPQETTWHSHATVTNINQ